MQYLIWKEKKKEEKRTKSKARKYPLNWVKNSQKIWKRPINIRKDNWYHLLMIKWIHITTKWAGIKSITMSKVGRYVCTEMSVHTHAFYSTVVC